MLEIIEKIEEFDLEQVQFLASDVSQDVRTLSSFRVDLWEVVIFITFWIRCQNRRRIWIRNPPYQASDHLKNIILSTPKSTILKL